MAALTCEICGGKLIGKPGGVFECDSCGMEYSTEWARNKIQEIKGTVKVEGTVEVTGKVQLDGGTVNVEGAATKESLLKRAKMCVNDGDWARANELLEQVLNADPECGEAYLYRAMAQNSCKTIEKLKEKYISGLWQSENDFAKALQFGAISAEQAQEWKKAREEKLHRLAKARERIKGAQGLLNNCLGVKADGTVYCLNSKREDGRDEPGCDYWRDIVAVSDIGMIGIKADGTVVSTEYKFGENWHDIVAVSDWYSGCKLGLRRDGTIVFEGDDDRLERQVSNWHDIIAINASVRELVGLKADGTVVIAGDKGDHKQHSVSNWHDIVSSSTGWGSWEDYVLGLKADGTIIAAGELPDKLYPVLKWTDIIAISTSAYLVVGLKEDGSVICSPKSDKAPSELDWRDIVAITTRGIEAIGLKSDGTVVSSIADSPRNSWKLFDNLDNLEEERRVARAKRVEEKRLAEERAREEKRLAEERAREEKRLAEEKALQEKKERIQVLHQEMDSLQAELAALRGLFTGRKRRELEARIEDANRELRELEASIR